MGVVPVVVVVVVSVGLELMELLVAVVSEGELVFATVLAAFVLAALVLASWLVAVTPAEVVLSP